MMRYLVSCPDSISKTLLIVSDSLICPVRLLTALSPPFVASTCSPLCTSIVPSKSRPSLCCVPTVFEFDWTAGREGHADVSLASAEGGGCDAAPRIALEFAVADVEEIQWNSSTFDGLTIPKARREILLALAKAHTGHFAGPRFDDVVARKGRGLIVLLQ